MSNEWRHARHYPIEGRSSYHIDEQGVRGQGDEMISRATPRSYLNQRDPPHPGSTPQETGREPFGWQHNRPNVEYIAAQPPSLGPIEYTQEMGDLPSRARFGDPRTSTHRPGSMSVHPRRQPDRGNPYQDPQLNEMLPRRLDHRRTSRGMEDLTGIEGFPLESSGTRARAIDDRQMDGSRGRNLRYYPGNVDDLTIGMDNVGLNDQTPTRPANHGQRDRASRRERETDRRRHADSIQDLDLVSSDVRAGVSGNGLDPTYQVQDRRFFRVGTVFAMLWHENAGQGTAQSQDIWVGKYGELVYSTIRRMVVVEEQRGCAWCLGIFTYNRKGVGKPGVDPSTHAVIFMKNSTPTFGLEEPMMTKEPIAVVPVSPDKKLDSMSRINFAKIYTVEHNVKVKHIGEIDKAYVHRLMGHYSRGGSSRKKQQNNVSMTRQLSDYSDQTRHDHPYRHL